MELLKKNEYIRTSDGYIGKLCAVTYNTRFCYFEWNKQRIGTFIEKIIDHKDNPQDLIRLGDYVNGYKVDDIRENLIYCCEDEYEDHCFIFSKDDIETIVTKEHYEKEIYHINL